MKKLLYLFLAITIISCGGDDDGNAPLDYLGTYRGDIIVYLNGNELQIELHQDQYNSTTNLLTGSGYWTGTLIKVE